MNDPQRFSFSFKRFATKGGPNPSKFAPKEAVSLMRREERYEYSAEGKEKEMLDVTHDLQQEILLSYPMQFLCREDCQGLCPQCGKKLNEGKCGCAPH